MLPCYDVILKAVRLIYLPWLHLAGYYWLMERGRLFEQALYVVKIVIFCQDLFVDRFAVCAPLQFQ